MQDRDIPPVEEGEADGCAAGVHPTIAAEDRAATASRRAEVFTAHPWITAIVLCSATIMATNQLAACGPASRRATSRRIRSRFQRGKTQAPASLPLSTTSSFWRRFRKQHAR